MNEERQPALTRAGFERLIAVKWGDDALEAVKDTIEPCPCGSPLCRGWKLDVDKLMDALP